MDKVSDVIYLSNQFDHSQKGVEGQDNGSGNFVQGHLKAGNFSKNSRREYLTEEDIMTLSNYSDSSSDILLSSSSLSPAPLSETSYSKSQLSSPQPRPKEKRSQRQKLKTTSRGSTYKHIPHRLKPPHIVAKRNARERKRVQAVNCAFSRLRKHVPFESRHRRLSKVKTLRFAIEYIQNLQELIADHDRQISEKQHIQGVYTDFNNHYFHHHHEQRNFVLNNSTQLYPGTAEETAHETRSNSTTPQIIPHSETLFIHLHNSTSELQAYKSNDRQYVFSQNSGASFVTSPQHCTSYSPQPVKESFSIIHNLSTCFHNRATEFDHSHSTTGSLSLTEHPPSTHLVNASICTNSQTETQETMTYEQQTSHIASFRRAFLYQDTPGIRNMQTYPHCLGSHFEITPPSPLTSFDACSHTNNSNTILSSNSIPHKHRIFRHPSHNTFLKVNVPEDCGNYTAQLRMFQMCSKNMKTVISDCPVTPGPQQLININQDFSFTHSHFDQ